MTTFKKKLLKGCVIGIILLAVLVILWMLFWPRGGVVSPGRAVQTEPIITKPFPAAKAEEPAFHEAYGETRQLVAENDRYELYLEYTYFNMAIVDKKSGFIWYSSPPEAQKNEELSGANRQAIASHLLVGYLNSVSRSGGTINSQLGSVRQKSATVVGIENGIRIEFDFTRKSDQFMIPVEYTLTDDGLQARIDYAGIKEYGDVLITDISLLPYFNCTNMEEQGYLLIPDGSGALIPFNSAKSSSSPYTNSVYGRDNAYMLVRKSTVGEDVYLPVFGHLGSDHSELAMIDAGAGIASITAMPAGGGRAYNYAYATFTFRGTDNAVLSDASWISKNVLLYTKGVSTEEKVGIRYHLMNQADIVKLATVCREDLQLQGLTTQMETAPEALYLELYGGIKKKHSYFGLILNDVEPMTTFSQAQTILQKLKDAGVDNIVVKYRGVLSGGMDDSVVLDSTLESNLGGKSGFEKLANYSRQNSVELFADMEFQIIYKSRLGWWPFRFAAKNVSQSPLVLRSYYLSTMFQDESADTAWLLSPSMLPIEIDSLLKNNSLPASVGIGAGSIGNLSYSDFDNGNYFDRDLAVRTTADSLEKITASGRRLMVSGGYAFAALKADVLFGIPLTDSMYDLTEVSVPFYSLVFHGYKQMSGEPVNLSEDPETVFLKCIENGICPTFTLTWEDGSHAEDTHYDFLFGSNYERWIEKISTCYAEFCSTIGDAINQPITGYTVLNEEVRCTQYANGRAVYVNYGNSEYVYDGIAIPARGYVTVGY